MTGWRKKQIASLIAGGEIHSGGGYSESTHEKQQEFDRKRTRVLCDSYLMPMLGKEELVDLWWNSSNLAFSGDTPNKAFEKDHRKVFQYILDSQGGW